jgi:hypothetical protein
MEVKMKKNILLTVVCENATSVDIKIDWSMEFFGSFISFVVYLR